MALEKEAATGPLEEAYGLDDREQAFLGEAFARALKLAGVDDSGIFARLKEGKGFAAALSLPPPVVEALYARARQWLAIGRAEKAAPLFRALALLEPGDADYWVGHGDCLRHSGRLADAKAAFASAAKLRPAWAIPHLHLLSLAVQRSDWAAAKDALAAFSAADQSGLPTPLHAEAARLRVVLASRSVL